MLMCSDRLAWLKDPYRLVNYCKEVECDLFFLSKEITMQKIWIMMFKLHWYTEQFVNSMNGKNEQYNITLRSIREMNV